MGRRLSVSLFWRLVVSVVNSVRLIRQLHFFLSSLSHVETSHNIPAYCFTVRETEVAARCAASAVSDPVFSELVVVIPLLGSPSSLFLLRSPHPSSASRLFLKPPPVLHLMKESVLDGEEFLSTLQPKQHLIPDSVTHRSRAF